VIAGPLRRLTSLRSRIFLTSWLLFGAMFATNVVREHYPALTLVEDGSYRLDRYHELHSDIFEHDGHWYINNNVGTSVIAAGPLLLFKPVLRMLDERSQEALARSGGQVDTSFDTKYPNRERFYRLVRQNGWELKFGAVAAITAVLLMAPLSALFVLLVFDFLSDRGVGRGRAAALALLFGFGTPVLFRTAHLNHNMMVMYATVGAFLVLVPRDRLDGMLPRAGGGRHFAAGLLGGAAVMCDFSGAVPLAWLFAWTVFGALRSRRADPAFFAAGAAIPILVQLHSQWASFGDWIHPPQTWMAQANFTDRGYQGFDWPAIDLFLDNLVEPRWGLFVFGPLLLIGLVPPRRGDASAPLPFRAWAWSMAFAFTFMLFAAANQYGRMQWNTGIRYLMPVVPFFFLAAANHLARMRGAVLALLGGAAVIHGWVVSMRRIVTLDRDPVPGVLEDWRRFLTEGPRIPWLDVLSRTATGRGRIPEGSVIHLAVIAGCLLLVLLLWWVGRRTARGPSPARTTRP
jgi:hypothetical protein